ncbi:hypothetical protein H6G97_27195 [Nostoc flagelliforme FACHB-838]|uniref:Transposase n=1 Tax=Nostoc flagelliforme FACHB-838 TaxID=2692904 RepID=A0ABR8DXS3_9NOSO|nr:hypothetical protein [Nostoc flagelliforme]MBD2533055.1 hypothetical protein [Nostoc flagelliforme FACHB-838]
MNCVTACAVGMLEEIAYGRRLHHRTYRNTKCILHFDVFQHLDHRLGYQGMGNLLTFFEKRNVQL